MRQRIPTYYLLSIILSGILTSCSTEKNTLVTRTYHNITSRYNIFFNGNESFKRGLEQMEESHVDDYTRILPVFLWGDENTAGSIAGDMETAIQKATKVITLHSITVKPEFKQGPQSEKQKAFYARNEYNKFVPENYLLMGKAYLFRNDLNLALETFKFIMTEYSYDDIIYETQVWIARTLNELGEYNESEDVLQVLTGTQEFPEDLLADLYSTQADLYMKQEDYKRAIEPMTLAVEKVRKKEEKIRWTFILAQLNQEAGDPQKASEYYRDVIKMNPPYEMSFNARINRASVFVAGSDNARDIRDELNKMLKDDKNRDFRDQIYFALGKVFFREGKVDEALKQYKLSSIYSVSNTQQKTTTCLTIADIYYERQEYQLADRYYDSAMVYLTQDYPDYETILAKTKSLSNLVENLQAVQLQDSLQMLASMPESARNALIDSIIARITLEESRTREQEMTTMQDQQFNRMALNESQRRSTSADQGGKWYFYNQAAKGFGQPEFRMKWGNRKLEDNWRRANKSQVKFENEESTEASDTSGALKEKTKRLSNKSREYYLRDIPMTDSMMELSNAKIIEGLYNAGTIYKNELRDYPRAVETYRDLQDRFPGNGFTLSVYYNLYRIFNDQKDPTKADIYKQAIIREFPESQPAQLLANPNYVAELQAKENEVNDFYEQTYNMYQRGDYQGVITNADLAGEKFTGDPVIPKFEFLKVLSIGKTRSRMVFTRALDSLARTSPDPEIAERSSSILAYIMNTDKEVKTETEKIAAEEIYRYDTAGAFSYGLFVSGKVDINQLKFEFINLNLDLFPNRTFNVVNEELQGRVNSILVQRFKGMEQAWDYYDQVFRNEKIIQVLGNSDYKLFIISQGNEKILTTDKTPNKYWLFFQKYYHRNESD